MCIYLCIGIKWKLSTPIFGILILFYPKMCQCICKAFSYSARRKRTPKKCKRNLLKLILFATHKKRSFFKKDTNLLLENFFCCNNKQDILFVFIATFPLLQNHIWRLLWIFAKRIFFGKKIIWNFDVEQIFSHFDSHGNNQLS